MQSVWRRNALVGLALLPLIVFGTTLAQAEKVEPTADLLTWLRENAHPLQSAVPIENDEDLEPLRTIVGDARIVALGEATHGTSEFFTMKHRIVQFLAEEMDFTVFSIEANMPEAYRMNEYVLTGEGDPKELLDGMYFWTWNTQEVLDMVLWMREFNASGQGVMQFTGFDMQTPTVAMEEVQEFVKRYDLDYLAELDEAYSAVITAYRDSRAVRPRSIEEMEASREAWRSGAEKVFDDLQERQANYGDIPAGEVAWALQNARLIVQNMEYRLSRGSRLRDSYMADNVEWILQQNPNAKMVIWAHNAHIKEASQPYTAMGDILVGQYEDDYFSVGFSFHSGQYVANGAEGVKAYAAEPAHELSVGGTFHMLALPLFVLDLSQVEPRGVATWFTRPQDARNIGSTAVKEGGAFYRTVLTDNYDAVIFVDQMTPTNLLP